MTMEYDGLTFLLGYTNCPKSFRRGDLASPGYPRGWEESHGRPNSRSATSPEKPADEGLFLTLLD